LIFEKRWWSDLKSFIFKIFLAITLIAILFVPLMLTSSIEIRSVNAEKETVLAFSDKDWLEGWDYRQTLNINRSNTSYSGKNFFKNYNVTVVNGTSFSQSQYDSLYNAAVAVLYGNVRNYHGYNTMVPHTKAYPIPYCWDMYFSTLAALRFNTTLARETINAEFATQNVNGMIPNAPTSVCDMDLRSQMPLLADAVLEYYLVTKDSASLKSWFPKLEAYYNWYETYGDPYGSINGLVSPLTGRRTPTDGNTTFYLASSTGLDNFPIYDYGDYANNLSIRVGNYYYLGISDLLLSSGMAFFAQSMTSISGILENSMAQTVYSGKFASLKNLINLYMWDSEDGLYKTVLWNGSKIDMNTVQAFLPLIANVSNRSQTTSLISHLTNTNEYNLASGVPTVAANDSSFYSLQPVYFHSADPHYWRGNIWAPTTYMVYHGLMNYGYVQEASEIAVKWLEMVNSERAYPFAEYYDARTGQAGGSLSNFSWTAAVTILLIDEVADQSNQESVLYINNKTQSDFSDIRFFISETPLYYWAKNVNAGVNATFWFKVPDNLAGKPIYVYYGNSKATRDMRYYRPENVL
jgi:neutral trehalase